MKRMRSLWILLAATGLGLVAGGCMTEPITGRSQFLMVSQAEEVKLGLQSWEQVQKESKPSTDKAKIAATERVGNAIKAVANKPEYQWEFKVIASPEANAFCLPGGKVAVYEGLFKYMSNEAELAVVIGHEVAHAIARHGAERMSESMAVQGGAAALSVALGASGVQNPNAWLTAYGLGAQIGVLLPYSRTHEYSADHIGIVLMARAGYDPEAAVAFWQRFSEGKKGSTNDFFSTHPADAKRIANLKMLMPKAAAEYQASPRKQGSGAKIQ